jgi:prepilin-type N-terminal cleavage/methylation domain-containing protein
MGHVRNRYLKRSVAFTLLELLVVISVIGTLAALLLPVLTQAREAGRRAACLANVHQLSLAHRLYIDDYDERFPNWEVKRPPDEVWLWTDLLRPYLRQRGPALFQCPGLRGPLPPGGLQAEYALCTWGASGAGTRTDPYRRWPGPPLTVSQVVRPGETVTLADGWTAPGWTVIEGGLLAAALPGHRPRHGNIVVGAFVDGHVRGLPATLFWRLATDGRGFYWYYYGTADRDGGQPRDTTPR